MSSRELFKQVQTDIKETTKGLKIFSKKVVLGFNDEISEDIEFQEPFHGLKHRLSSTSLMIGAGILKSTTQFQNNESAIAKVGLIYKWRKAIQIAGETKSIKAGAYMDIDLVRYRAMQKRKLSDGTFINPGDRIGEISFVSGIPILGEEDNLIAYTRALYASAKDSLRKLASMCEENNPRLNGVVAFMGLSHLAGPLAERLGFEVYEITNPLVRFYVTRSSFTTAKDKVFLNKSWQQYSTNYKPAREAVISRNRLVLIHGNDQQKPHAS